MPAAVISTTSSACQRSLQSISARRWLLWAVTKIATANAIISPAISFGIMPAPGAEMVPNGRSPLSANTSTPSAMKKRPAA